MNISQQLYNLSESEKVICIDFLYNNISKAKQKEIIKELMKKDEINDGQQRVY